MAINFRGVGSVPDGSITSAKLADNAVTTNKLADDAVSTVKIQNDAVNTTKVSADLGIQHFLGYETDLSVTGTTETSVGEFNFTKSGTTTENWLSFGYAASLKSSNVSNTATINFYIDTVLIATDGTTSTTYFFSEDDSIDISSLTTGVHKVEVKLVNDTVGETATINKLDVYLGKKSVA